MLHLLGQRGLSAVGFLGLLMPLVSFIGHVTAIPLDGTSVEPRGLTIPGLEIQYCSGTEQTTLMSAWGEMSNALDAAAQRLGYLLQWLQSNPTDFSGLSVLSSSTLKTFESIYGPIYDRTAPAVNQEGIQRVQNISALIGNMTTSIRNPLALDLTIFCDSLYLSATDQDGNSLPNDPNVWFDTVINEWLDLNKVGGGCYTEGTKAYRTYYPSHNIETVTLCSSSWDLWNSQRTSGSTYSQISDTTFGQDLNLDYFELYLQFTLLHELSHSLRVTSNQWYRLDDETCDIHGQVAYAFGCVTDLASTSPSKALNNAQSFAMFVTAMNFNNNDWSQGFAQPI